MKKLLSVILWGALPVSANVATSLAQKETTRQPIPITAEMVRPHVVELASDKYEGRGAGYPGELKAARYIAAEFKRLGLKPVGDSARGRSSYLQEFKFHPYHPTKPWQLMTSRNVLGFIEGTDAILKSEVVVIGAHYDGQGRAGQADPTRRPATDANASDEIWNSANDNASSIAALLEIARAIKRGKMSTKRSILFGAFGAEEHGVAGSLYYVTHPAFPLSSHVAMLNLEKLGREPEKPFRINGGASSKAWQEVIKAAQEQTKTKVAMNIPYNIPDSDHYPFSASRVPSVMLFVATNTDMHQPSDSSDKIDFARVAEAANYAMAVLMELSNRDQRPEYAASPIPDLGLIAHLITNAEADAAGLGPEESGLKVTGVIPGLPSAAAGLKAGDLILEAGPYRLRRTHTLAELMGMQREIMEGKLGTKLSTVFIRDKKRSTVVINLGR